MNIANPEKRNAGNADEVSIGDIFTSLKNAFSYIKTKWLTIVLISLLGGLAGLAFSILKKPVYSATSTFVLEEAGKGGGLGQYAGLASLAGIDLGGAGGGGIFQGDNIIELYKSRLMIEKTLLSKAKFNNQETLLIDRYIDFKKLRKKWKDDDGIDSITFNGNPEKFNRHQDSIITDITETFNKKYLTVLKPDKKLSIIQVIFAAGDELFAKEFNNKLVENVNEFYTITKTKKSDQNVRVLQRQADSVKQVLNASISGVASAIDASPNANPQLLSLRVPSQKKQVDVQASTAVYGEIVKNLEISKITLRQEKPLIQVIDSPVLPLFVAKVGKVKGILIGVVLGCVLCIFSLLLFRLFRKG
jgi:tetrahydromethanopterin S-methyltransferase subunit G